jgi:hypothetical protein
VGKDKFSVNINNKVLLGIDEFLILNNVEILVPKRAWIRKIEHEYPDANVVSNIGFSGILQRNTFLEMPVKVITDMSYSFAYVLFGKEETEGQLWVELSNQCLALLYENRLHGFFIRLT